MKKNLLVLVTFISMFSLTACQTNSSSDKQSENYNNTIRKEIVSGKIKGKKDKKNKVIEWLGIPYAQAPVGNLRWKAPKTPKKWTKTFDASKYGNAAIQYSNGQVTGSEASLNLDVVRPDTKKKNLPVLVYIHGGNNQTGTAQEIKGNSFVKELNAVYVSVNYRLGVLGFNPLAALKDGNDAENSGNFSLLDIAFALDWVKNNIETFGGDKNNVTLAGFSAGGRDVMATLISPLFKGKYDKIISFSGGMTLSDEKEGQEIFAKALAPLVVEDGIKANEEEAKIWLLSTGSDVKSYLNNLSADRLAPLMGNAAIRMSIFPHLYKDGKVIPSEGFNTKNYNDVPAMLITGTNEFSLFAAYDNRFSKDFTSGDLFKDSQKNAEYLYARNYGSQFYRLSNGVESARIMTKNYKSPIYIGEISYGDDKDVTPNLAQTLGAFHGIFEPMLQDPSNYKTFIGQEFEQAGAKSMSQAFKTYLKNFLASSNPNGNNLSKWSQWSTKNNVLSISADKKKYQIKSTVDTETAQDIIDKMQADTSLTDAVKENLNTTVLNGRWFSGPLDSLSGQ